MASYETALFPRNRGVMVIKHHSKAVGSLGEIELPFDLFFTLLSNLLSVVRLGIFIIGVSSWWPLLALLMAISFLLIAGCRKRQRRLAKEQTDALTDLLAWVGQILEGRAQMFLPFTANNTVHKRTEHFNTLVNKAILIRYIWFRLLILFSSELAGVWRIAIVLGVGILRLWAGASIPIGSVFVVLNNLSSLQSNITMLIDLQGRWHKTAATLERVLAIMNIEPHIQDPDPPHARSLPAKIGSIEFKQVSFGYDTDRPVLEDLSFSCKAGELVAFVGHTGAGKSTLLKLLARFDDPWKGSIEIGGVDIKDVRVGDLHSRMGFVLQEQRLLQSMTIQEFLLTGFPRKAEEEEVIKAARKASIHDLIASLPEGYDTPIGEKGYNFSGGERQRIVLAGMFLRNPDIVLLDERTSAVDNETQRAIKFSIDKLREAGTTIFVVAHRLSTIKDADSILVIKEGRLVGQGTHEKLLRESDPYRQLYLEDK